MVHGLYKGEYTAISVKQITMQNALKSQIMHIKRRVNQTIKRSKEICIIVRIFIVTNDTFL